MICRTKIKILTYNLYNKIFIMGKDKHVLVDPDILSLLIRHLSL